MESTTAVNPLDYRNPLNPLPTASRYRWWVVVLLFFATTINYVDRQLFANLVPYFEDELRIGPMDLAYINVAFILTYGLGMTLVGRYVDRVGVRIGLASTFLLWTLASTGHALVYSVGVFIAMRILLGIGEAGNFPASIKAVAEWFPKRERALATGWFNCGSNIGAVVTPLLVPVIALRYGWRTCFFALSSVGIVWLFFWLRTYRSVEGHPKVSADERDYIRSDPPETVERVGVLTLLGQRQVYGVAMARFFTEAPWWFYLTWGPKLLSDRFGLSAYELGIAIASIYLIADFGAVGGGWISSRLIKRGHSVNYARKVALLIAATGTLPVITIAWLQGGDTVLGIPAVWIAVPILALAASSHQAWSSNVYTVVSDTLPKAAVATTVGISQAFGAVGSSALQLLIAGWLIKTSGSYSLPLVLSGCLYFVGLLALHLILPRLEPARIDNDTRSRVKWWQVAAIAGLIAMALVALQAALIRLNTPAYGSVDEYYAKRQTELQATTHVEGPKAKVGWQDAQWIFWTMPNGTVKPELIKLDDNGTPFLEGKGAGAKKYVGPSAQELTALQPSSTTQPQP